MPPDMIQNQTNKNIKINIVMIICIYAHILILLSYGAKELLNVSINNSIDNSFRGVFWSLAASTEAFTCF